MRHEGKLEGLPVNPKFKDDASVDLLQYHGLAEHSESFLTSLFASPSTLLVKLILLHKILRIKQDGKPALSLTGTTNTDKLGVDLSHNCKVKSYEQTNH